MTRWLASSTRLFVVVTFLLLAGSLVATAATGSGEHGGEYERTLAPVLQPESLATDSWPPAAFLVIGGVGILLLPSRIRGYAAVLLSAFTLWYVWNLPDGARLVVGIGGQDLTLMRVDRLSLVFGKIFVLIGVIAGIYALHQRDTRQQVAALLYNAGALGVTFAGDYLTLYVFWELMAVSSVLLIWARRDPESDAAGRRYILVHLVGGAVLLGGVLMHFDATGSLAFERFAPGTGGAAAWLILIGFCLNAAVPPLGAWLPDAYPRATVTGAIFCSALTTKTAVYTLIRGFTGWEILAVAGVVMTLYGVVYAVLSNNIRELLGYHIISQVGYMVAGVGIGTAMAVNGAAAHAVSHILYKALLFMGAGVVIHTTGREKVTELGGFWSRQKLVFGLYMIGAFSISGFPLWNGFISKSMVVAAAGALHWDWAFLLLMLASVGTFLSIGLKLPYGTWLGEDRGIRPEPTPVNMVAAMAVAAFLCTIMGVLPGLLYTHLPYEVHWDPWTTSHVMEAVQMLLFTFFVFYLFIPKFVGRPTISMDTDVLYRKPAPAVRAVFVHGVGAIFDGAHARVHALASRLAAAFRDPTEWIPGWPERVESDDPGYDEDRARLPLILPFTLTLIAFGVIAGWRFLG
jgi:multicomponent Na+:H+ antiporter subunit D